MIAGGRSNPAEHNHPNRMCGGQLTCPHAAFEAGREESAQEIARVKRAYSLSIQSTISAFVDAEKHVHEWMPHYSPPESDPDYELCLCGAQRYPCYEKEKA